jgi:endonuclease III
LQELAATRFEVLVAAMLLNRTRREQVDPVWTGLLARWPDVDALAGADVEELADALRTLGLQRRRARLLIRLASTYRHLRRCGVRIRREEVETLPGCGRYAVESWAIFVEGDLDVDPADDVLAMRVAELREGAC